MNPQLTVIRIWTVREKHAKVHQDKHWSCGYRDTLKFLILCLCWLLGDFRCKFSTLHPNWGGTMTNLTPAYLTKHSKTSQLSPNPQMIVCCVYSDCFFGFVPASLSLSLASWSIGYVGFVLFILDVFPSHTRSFRVGRYPLQVLIICADGRCLLDLLPET